jgi:hypothetical protein
MAVFSDAALAEGIASAFRQRKLAQSPQDVNSYEMHTRGVLGKLVAEGIASKMHGASMPYGPGALAKSCMR